MLNDFADDHAWGRVAQWFFALAVRAQRRAGYEDSLSWLFWNENQMAHVEHDRRFWSR